ncbi:MAG: ATP-dependent Clp protease adaptor ClpS, partial [Methylotenera sp.]
MANINPNQDLAIKPSVVKPKLPAMYKVLLLNDDYTPMEFVVETIERFFNKSREQATQ